MTTADTLDKTLAKRYFAPSEEQFWDDDDKPTIDFVPANDLKRIAEQMISEYSEFSHLRNAFTVTYLWKRDGGKIGGKATLGKCTKPSGLLKYFADTTFVIWLAANHVNDMMLTTEQVRACTYHELSHAQVEVDEEGEAKPVVAPHDFQGFNDEIRRFGSWMSDLRDCRDAWEEGPLFGAASTRDPFKGLVPKPGSGIDSVTISDEEGHSVTLDAAARRRIDEQSGELP